MTDLELLSQYAESRCETAFSELVQRHSHWIRSAAKRMVRDEHLADDVTQATFLALAQNAARWRTVASFSGWLFRVVRYTAYSALRGERRRRDREQEVAAMSSSIVPEAPTDEWSAVAPMLDDLVSHLWATDRQAILLRFYQQRSFSDIGRDMGISEEAARKRVARAVEKLRRLFAGRGVAVPVAGLASVLFAHATEPASAGVVAAARMVITGFPAQWNGSTIIYQGAKHMMWLGRAKVIAAALLLAALIVPLGVYALGPIVAPATAPTVPDRGPALSAQPVAASSPVTVPLSQNAAELYRQAFALLPQDAGSMQLLGDWDQVSLSPRTAALLKRLEPAVDLTHRAAALPWADWQVEYNDQGLQQWMPQLTLARRLAQLLALDSRQALSQRNTNHASEDLLAAVALGRHLSAEPVLINRQISMAIEEMSIRELGRILPDLTSGVLQGLPEGWAHLPPMPSLAQTAAAEHRFAIAKLRPIAPQWLTPELDAFYPKLAAAFAATPEKFPAAWRDAQAAAKAAGPMTEILLPSMGHLRENEDELLTMRALLLAAIAIQRNGPTAVAQTKDPLSGGPFTLRPLPTGGFELQGSLVVKNKPVTLQVGHGTSSRPATNR